MRHPRAFARVLAALTLAAAALAGPAAVLPARADTQDFPIAPGATAGAIQGVLTAAKTYTAADPNRTATVTFPSGEFRLDAPLKLYDADRVTIRGAGQNAGGTTLLTLGDRLNAFDIRDCEDITLQDLRLDRPDANLPWTQLTVVDASNAAAGYIDVTADAGYPDPMSTMFDPYVNSSNVTVSPGVLGFPLDGDGQLSVRFFRPDPDMAQWRTSLGNGVYRLYYADIAASTFFDGQRIALITAVADGITLSLPRNKDIVIERVTNLASNYMGLWSSGMENLTLRNYETYPGPGRLLSSTRDAVHLTTYNKGKLIVDHSVFRGSGDDAINFTMISSGGLAPLSSTQVTVADTAIQIEGHPSVFEPGDQLEIYRKSDRTLLGRPKVLAVSPTSASCHIPDRSCGIVTFDQPVTGMAEGDLILNEDATFADADITNNVFGNLRGHGIRPHGRNVLVRGNEFTDTPAGLLVHTVATRGGEGPINANLIVDNNDFTRQDYRGAIVIGGDAIAGASDSSATGFTITSNRFTDITVPAVRVEHGRDITIETNDVTPAAGSSIYPIQLGTLTNQPHDVTVTDLDAIDPTMAAVRAGVIVNGGTTGVAISDVTGDFRSPAFINDSGLPVTYEGVTAPRALGSPGLTPTGWGFAAGTQGWTGASCVTLGASGGRLQYTATCADSYVHSPAGLDVAASTVAAVKLTLRNPTTATSGQLYFTTAANPTWSSTRSVPFTVPASMSSAQEIVIPVAGTASWTGTVTRLRLDLPDQATTTTAGTVDVDSITLSPAEVPTVGRSWDFEAGLGDVVVNDTTTYGVQSGELVLTNVATTAAKVRTPDNLGLDAGDYRYLRLTVANGAAAGRLNVFFTTTDDGVFDEAKKLTFNLAPSSGPATYYLDLTHVRLTPDDTIRRLRLDLPYVSGQSAESAIDEFALVSDLSVDAVNS